MCRDGYWAECAEDGCSEVLRCRDYTKCATHAPEQWEW